MSPAQRNAADSNQPLVLCLAGPGSGKTTTLVEAVYRRCIEDGPQSVICLTFTNAGAQEMKERLAKRYEQDSACESTSSQVRLGFCGTLHSFLLRLLRKQFQLAGLSCPPSVIEESTAISILIGVARDLGCKTSERKLIEQLRESNPFSTVTRRMLVDEIVLMEFHRRLQQEGLLTHDALLHYGLRLIKAFDSWGFKHLFVDECQDGADIDFEIYNAMPCQTKFYVGDPDQAIYGFRGGNVQNIVLMNNCSIYETHFLETNYRCRQGICDAANSLIGKNSIRVEKFTRASEGGGLVRHFLVDSPISEMMNVAGMIAENIASGIKPESQAVLCRTNRQAKEFSDFLRSQGVAVAFSERPPEPSDWRKAMLVVSALAAPQSDLAWLALVEAVDGPKAAEKLKGIAAVKMRSVRETLIRGEGHEIGQRWYQNDGLLSMSGFLGVESRARLHDACRELSIGGEWTMADLANYLKSGERRETKQPGVAILTAHGAKGREWEAVFIVGLEEGSFPQAKKDTDIEEERRLMFVAVTRAKNQLTLLSCAARPQNRGPNLPPGPLEPKQVSRFVKEAGL